MAKKSTTSSYPQNVSLIESPWTKEEKEDVYTCPECGERAVRWVTGDCKLLDGAIIPDLERMQCSSCGENLFDLAAMRRIREVRESLKTKPKSRRSVTKKIMETKNA